MSKNSDKTFPKNIARRDFHIFPGRSPKAVCEWPCHRTVRVVDIWIHLEFPHGFIGGVSRFREGNEVRFISHIDKWRHMEAHGGFNGKMNYNNYKWCI
jgi:hypothetical protein